jgi:starvation-inducible DNA-binding protein
MKPLFQALNVLVADLNVMFVKLHHHHWYVTGPRFFSLHAKFEELYDHVNELYDDVAERLITLGGQPASSLKAYLALTNLKEAESISNADQIVISLIEDFNQLLVQLKKVLVLAQEESDEPTADLMIGSISEFEKTLWMLKASQQ